MYVQKSKVQREKREKDNFNLLFFLILSNNFIISHLYYIIYFGSNFLPFPFETILKYVGEIKNRIDDESDKVTNL